MSFPMSKVLPGLYIGNIVDAQDVFKNLDSPITHVIALRSYPKRLLMLYHYIHIPVADAEGEHIGKYFSICNDAIHSARLERRENNVLVHCYAGISRSATIVIAYLMTIANLSWDVASQVLERVRPVVRPNPDFQQQLRHFQYYGLRTEQKRLFNKYPSKKLETWDRLRIEAILSARREICSRGTCAINKRSNNQGSDCVTSDDEDDRYSECFSQTRF